jgi:hypothetical protein
MKNPKKTNQVYDFQHMEGPKFFHSWKAVDCKGFQVILNANDISDITIGKALACCDLHNFSAQDGNQVSQVYYLRGRRSQAAYDQVLIGAYHGPAPMDYELIKIFECITFWNQEGVACYKSSSKGVEVYAQFILRCIASDCEAFTDDYGQYYTGRSGDHVWVADSTTGRRLIIIHF